MKFRQILSDIRNLISYSKARYSLDFDDNIYYEISGFKARIVNLVNIIYNIINLKSEKIHISERIVELPFLYKNLDFNKIEKILDLGCVGSKISLQLASLGYCVVGIDYRPYIFKHKKLKFLQGNFIEMDIAPESFDCVICISTIEHIGLPAYNIKPFKNGDKKSIAKIFKLLKRGGKLILTVPFGKNLISNFERNYDYNSLKNLLIMFKIVEFDIYEKTKKGWSLSNNYYSELDKIACISCIKE